MWEEHLEKFIHKNEFHIRYHMTKESFDKLVDLIDIDVDEIKNRNSTSGIDTIDSNIVVACGLRWLGGESHKSIADISHRHLFIKKSSQALHRRSTRM